MSEAERTGLEHVILPRRLPGLALLERILPSPPDNLLDAELSAFATPGDTILDPWAGTGWTPRRAITHGMRSVAADPSPFAQMAAIGFLTAPEPAVLDAAFAQLGARRSGWTCPCGSTSRSCTRRAAPPAARRWWSTSSSGRATPMRRDARSTAARPARLPSAVPRSGWPPWMTSTSPSSGSRAPIPSRSRSARRSPTTCRLRPTGLTGLDEEEAPGDASARTTSAPRIALGEGGEPPPPAPLAVDPPTAVAEGPRFASTVRPEPRAGRGRRRAAHLPAVPGAAGALPGARRSGRPRRGAARPVHAAQPVRAPRHRVEDRVGAARPRDRGGHAAGAGDLPAARQPAERVSRTRGLAAHRGRPRPPAGQPPPARGERLARLRAGVSRRPRRRRRGPRRSARGPLRVRVRRAGRHGRGERAVAANAAGPRRPVPPGRGRRPRPRVTAGRRRRSTSCRSSTWRPHGSSAARQPRPCGSSRSSAARAIRRARRRRRCATAWPRRRAR